jgi:hypothetical protein
VFVCTAFGVLAVLTAFSVYLMADSLGSASGVAEPEAATAAVERAEQPGLDAGVAPAGTMDRAVQQSEVEDTAAVQAAVAGEASGVVAGQAIQQASSSSDPAAAGVASR